MSGLNDGNELDDELSHGVDEEFGEKPKTLDEALFDELIPGEVPELDEEVEVLAAVVNKFNNLTYLSSDINAAQGMNKTFAMEAERIMPGFLNEDVPLGYFTEEPTGTRLKLSLEAIAAEQKSLLQRIIESIVAMIRKAVQWLSDTYHRIFDAKREQDVANVYTGKAEAVNQTLNKVQKNYLTPDRAVADIKALLSKGDEQATQSYLESLERQLNAGDERITRLYKSINSGNEMYHIAVKSDIVEHILQLSLQSDRMVAAIASIDQGMLKEILDLTGQPEAAVIRAAAVKKALERLPQSFQVDKSYDAFAQSMAMTFNSRIALVTPEKFPLPKVFENYRQLFTKYNTKALREHIGKSRASLEELQKVILAMTTSAAVSSRERNAVSPILNDIFRLLFSEMRGLMRIIIQAAQIVSAWSWMAETLNKISDSYEFKIRQHLSGLDPEELKKVEEYFDLKSRAVGDAGGKTS